MDRGWEPQESGWVMDLKGKGTSDQPLWPKWISHKETETERLWLWIVMGLFLDMDLQAEAKNTSSQSFFLFFSQLLPRRLGLPTSLFSALMIHESIVFTFNSGQWQILIGKTDRDAFISLPNNRVILILILAFRLKWARFSPCVFLGFHGICLFFLVF